MSTLFFPSLLCHSTFIPSALSWPQPWKFPGLAHFSHTLVKPSICAYRLPSCADALIPTEEHEEHSGLICRDVDGLETVTQREVGKRKINCQHLLDHWKSKRIPEKHLLLIYWLHQSLFDCVAHNKLWKNPSRDGNTSSPYPPPEKSIGRSRSNS